MKDEHLLNHANQLRFAKEIAITHRFSSAKRQDNPEWWKLR